MYYWQDDQDQVRRLRALLAARLRAVLAAVPTDVAAYAITASRHGVAAGGPALRGRARGPSCPRPCPARPGPVPGGPGRLPAGPGGLPCRFPHPGGGGLPARHGHGPGGGGALRAGPGRPAGRPLRQPPQGRPGPGGLPVRRRCRAAQGRALRGGGRGLAAGRTERQQAACLYDAGSALAEAGRYEEVPAVYQAAVDLYPGLREAGQEEIDLLRTAWSAQCFADSPSCLRRLRRGL